MTDPCKPELTDNVSASEPTNEGAENQSPGTKPTPRWLRGLQWRAHWLFPNLIRHDQGDRTYVREHDKKENERSRIPADQNLRARMIWGIELYGPTEIDALYAGLKKLDWGSAGSWKHGDGALNWIRQQRSYGSGGWFNVGYVLRREQRGRFPMIHNYAPLPAGVDSLLVGTFQLSPSLTGVLVGFKLEECLARRYEAELNRDRVTSRERSHRPRAISIISPRNQKQRVIEALRADLRRMAGSWFRRHLPGYFCGLEHPAAFPTMELLTVQDGPILQDPTIAEAFYGWRRLLANVGPSHIWTYGESAGLQLAMDRYSDENEGLHIVAALDVAAFAGETLKYGGENAPDAYIHACNELLGGLLVHASTVEYLREQSRDLNITREKLKTARSGRNNVMRTLHEIRLFFDRTLGTPVIARELAGKSKEAGWYRHDCSRFTAPAWGKTEKPRELSEEIRGRVHFLASRLTNEETAIRAHFEQLSSILSIRESIKAQRRMEWLTILAVSIAVVSLVVALSSPSKLIHKLNDLWPLGASSLSRDTGR